MIKSTKHIAIISLLVCLLASLVIAFSFGSVTKANAEGETSYTLTFLGEPTNMIKEGWDSDATIEDGVLTVKIGGENHTANIEMLAGVTYKIKFDYQKVAGEKGWATFHLYNDNWTGIQTGIAATETVQTLDIEYTPKNSCSYLILQYANGSEGDDTVMFSNFTITKVVDTKTFTAESVIGKLPAIPEKTGYIGHWEMDGEPVTAETNFAATEDKVATVVYEKPYTLTFLGEPANITASVAGWSGGTKTDDGVKMTLADSTNYCNTSVLKFVAGNAYTISYEDRYVSGEDGWAAYHLWEGDSWAVIGMNITAVSEWAAHSFTYTPKATNSSTIWFQYRDGNKEVEFKNFTITEVIDTKTFTAENVIGELPAIPEKTGYIGHWEMDGEPVTAETNFAATEDKVAKAVYEKAYTLTFITNKTTFDMLTPVANATVDGFVVNYSVDWGYVKTSGVTITSGKKYKLEIVAKKTSGEGQILVLYDAGGSVDGVLHTLADDYATLTIEFTAEKGATGIMLQSSKEDTVFDFESVVLTEFETRTLKADQKIGELPEIPCGTNYRGYWMIGDTELTSTTTIDKDTTATPVIEYDGHVFTTNDFAFEQAKNNSENGTATLAIKYKGTEEVTSWTDKTWVTGQFADQIITLNVKKADGTETTVTSSQLQLNSSILWFSFASKIYGEIVEITIPAGEYKLSDGTGFKLEAITLYQVHYNCWLTEKVDYTVEHVAEVAESCTADGCLDYYHCEKCAKYFEDEDCTAEIEDIEAWKLDENGGLLEKTGHEAGSEWESDNTNHWHVCENCDAKMDEAAHADTNNDKKCDTCGLKIGSDDKSDDSGKTDSGDKTDDSGKTDSGDKTDDSGKTDSGDKTDDSGKTDSGDKTDTKTDDGKKKSGCSSSISSIAPMMLVLFVGLIAVVLLRKNKKNN